jgi:hypothetical protein
MNSRASNSIGMAALLVVGGITLLSDPKCNCGCRTLAEHLIRAGFGLLSGSTS